MANNPYHSYHIIPMICLVMTLSLVLYSCSDRLDGIQKEESFTIEQAKRYFEDNSHGLSLVEYLQPSTKSIVPSRYENITPDWESAKIKISNGVVTIAANLVDSKMYRATLQLTAGKKKIATEGGVSFSSFLVVQKNTYTGAMSRFVVTTVGHNNAGPAVFFGEKPDFRGVMMFSTETGRCFKAYEVHNSHYHRLHMRADTSSNMSGENRMAIKFGFSVSSHVHTRGGGGDNGYSSGEDNNIYCYACSTLTNFNNGYCANCGAPPEEIGGGEFYYFCPQCGRIEEECICTPETPTDPEEPDNPTVTCPICGQQGCNGDCQGNQGGSGGGTGSNPGIVQPIGTIHVHRPGEYLLPNVRDNITTQLANSCTIYSLNYISEILGKIITAETLFLHCYQNYSVVITDDGLNYAQTIDLINHYFYATNEYTIIAALNSGYPVFGMIVVDNPDDIHCVAIVGYNPDYSLIVMDPETGRLTDIDTSPEIAHITITGVK